MVVGVTALASHTVPMKVHGACGSVRLRLIPAPSGSGLVGSLALKKLLNFAGVADCFSWSHEDERQLHESNIRAATRDILLPHTGSLEASALCETTFPEVFRLPSAVQAIAYAPLKLQ